MTFLHPQPQQALQHLGRLPEGLDGPQQRADPLHRQRRARARERPAHVSGMHSRAAVGTVPVGPPDGGDAGQDGDGPLYQPRKRMVPIYPEPNLIRRDAVRSGFIRTCCASWRLPGRITYGGSTSKATASACAASE